MNSTYQIPDELLSRCAGQASICQLVVRKYVEQMIKDLAKARELAEAKEGEALSKIAHRMKGASANVAATELSTLAADMERYAERGELDSAKPLVMELERAWTEYEQLTEHFVAEDAQPCGS